MKPKPITDMRSVTPKSLILDLLRVASPRAISVRAFVTIGEIFGLSGNAVRVALTRLGARAVIESDERGWYRLAPAATALSSHVEEWRLGERRVRPWDGAWLACWLPRGAARPARRRSLHALTLMGFQQGLDGLCVRPDNLALRSGMAFEKLRRLGLETDARPFSAHGFDDEVDARFRGALWNARQLARAYRQAREGLERSARRIDTLPVGEAAVETFLLGGSAIHLLATDPLLPAEMVDTAERARLTDTMLTYDTLGRRAWSKLLRDVRVGEAPTHLAVLTGGAA